MDRELYSVFGWAPDTPQERVWTVGEGGVTKIEIRATGHGPMGMYDVVKVYTRSGPYRPLIEMPAHGCRCWVLIGEE